MDSNAASAADWSSLQGLSILHIFLGAQTVLVGSALIGHVAQGTSLESKIDPPAPGEEEKKPRFYQFRKRIHTYYLVGFLWSAWILWNFCKGCCLGRPVSGKLVTLMEIVNTPKYTSVDSSCTILALAFYLIHLVRRLYESLSVSIFSRRQMLSPLDLFWSFSFYITAGVALIADGQHLSDLNDNCFSVYNLSWYHGIGIGLFLWASIHHNKCHRILAKLRRNRAGHIVTTSYKLPKGDWFDQLSCPHYFAEVLIYLSISFLLGLRSVSWWWVVGYVFATQLSMAFNTHQWYLKKFPDYPKHRKMIIPFAL